MDSLRAALILNLGAYLKGWAPFFMRVSYGFLDSARLAAWRRNRLLAMISAICRFLFVLGAVLASTSVLALVPVSTQYRISNGDITTSWGSRSSACSEWLSARKGQLGAGYSYNILSTEPTCQYQWMYNGSNTGFPSALSYEPRSGCPANSTAQGAECSCDAGHVEVDGQCKPKKDEKCGDLEGKGLGLDRLEINVGVASNASLGRMIGNPGNSCFPGGCKVSGTVSSCVNGASSGAVCFINSPSFTGDSCDDKEKPGNCPAGTTPSEYAAGVCIPDKNNCPSGSSPSKYAAGVCIPDENPCGPGQSPSKYASGVCLPNEDPNSTGNGEDGDRNKCPTGRCPSKYVKDLCIPCESATDKDGSTVCKDGICTTTKPDGSTEEKPKDTFCAENPDSPLCVKGQFSGGCSSGFSCEGDAVQCAIAKQQHEHNCRLLDTENNDRFFKAAVDGTDPNSADQLRGSAQQVTVDAFDQSGLGWSRSCPQDPQFEVAGGTFEIPFHKVCGPLNVLAIGALGLTLLSCLLWVVGRKD